MAVDEDDGQLARELVPVDEAFMRKGDDEDDDGDSDATLGLEQKGESAVTFESRKYNIDIKHGTCHDSHVHHVHGEDKNRGEEVRRDGRQRFYDLVRYQG